MYHAMPLPLHYHITTSDLGSLVLILSVLFNVGSGFLTQVIIRKLMKAQKRAVNLYEETLLEAEELNQRATCLVSGHQWRIDTQDLQNPEDKEMTVMVKCECEHCHTRLDFEVRFGLHQVGPGKVGAWANILPTRPPG